MSGWPRTLCKAGKRLLAALVLQQVAAFQLVAAPPTDRSLENAACIGCHAARDPGVVSAWRASAHGGQSSPADCVACHGDRHEQAAPRARRDATCSACHGGDAGPVAHSYATSKHGTLVRLEQEDWTRPLTDANYRAPGCAYCHLHAGHHDVGAGVRVGNPIEDTAIAERDRIQDTMREVCRECHSPRYVNRLFSNGERMLSIARMKVREAGALLKQAAVEFSAEELAPAQEQMERMQQRLKNVLLGAGHQSPDYQWWHGQPALDGDLLRIKGMLDSLRQRRVGADRGADT